jgi:hypothetical protein
MVPDSPGHIGHTRPCPFVPVFRPPKLGGTHTLCGLPGSSFTHFASALVPKVPAIVAIVGLIVLSVLLVLLVQWRTDMLPLPH